MNLRFFFILILFFSFSIPSINADCLVVNSKDWHDVYLGFQYADFKNFEEVYFIQSYTDSEVISKLIYEERDGKVVVIESEQEPFLRGYEKFLELKGFSNVETIQSKTPFQLQLVLAELLKPDKFIVVQSEYGYDAISVSPYAHSEGAWVLFVDHKNTEELKNFLDGEENILLYGNLDRRIYGDFSSLDVEKINNGDKFQDNKEIVSRLAEKHNSRLVLLTSGRFIETELIGGKGGKVPVLFFDNAEETVNFLNKNGFELVQVVGESEQSGRSIRETSNKEIAVLVKYAMTYRGIEDLENLRAVRMFEVPVPFVKMSVDSIDYDTERDLLLVKYTNMGNDEAYFTSRISIVSESAGDVGEVQDGYVHSLHPGESFLVPYEFNGSLRPGENYDAHVFCLYGSAIGAMNQYITEQGRDLPPYRAPIARTRIQDNSSVVVESVDFAVADYMFVVKVRNDGDKTAFVDAEIFDFMVNERSNTYSFDNSPGFEGAKRVPPGESKLLAIDAELLEEDFKQNQSINLALFYGQDKYWMINQDVKRVAVHLDFEKILMTGLMSFISSWWWAILGFILLVLLIVWRRKKKEEEKEIQTVSTKKSRELTDFLGKK